jgi:N-hydroxyarylamine O-acetyltransferase
MNPVEAPLDLDAYLSRVEYRGALISSAGILAALHLAHVTHIPFENLDVLLGQPIRLDLASLQEKLVRGRRGGYCFEQNALFAAVLEHLGFTVTRLAARVRLGGNRVTPRTHMVLSVEAGGHSWLADVGFGGWGLLEPIPFTAGGGVDQFGWVYRLEMDRDAWVLQAMKQGDWHDMYAFTLEPQLPVDYELGNHFCSTHPLSPFVQNVTAQLALPHSRRIIRGGQLTIIESGGERSEAIQSDEQLLQVLSEYFGLSFPLDTRFRPRYAPEKV